MSSELDSPAHPVTEVLPAGQAIRVFLAFAFSYFFSALIRTITATLSPTLTQEFSLSASDLGLLAGGYFLGFSATQLPLGTWLDRYGPRKMLALFLAIAVVGCLAFSQATGFTGLLAARMLCGVGVSACLMAPLTAYRRWFDVPAQLRANSWMLMTGSLGMIASSLPVQWLMPLVGWRPLFLGLAAFVTLAILMVVWQVPAWPHLGPKREMAGEQHREGVWASYADVWRHPYFRKMVPVGFFCYGGLLAMQTLWVVPWMTRVAGYSPHEAATGFFWINVAMLFTFWAWGLARPRLAQRGIHADRVIAAGLPASFVLLALLVFLGDTLRTRVEVLLALYCMGCSCVSLSQPAVGMAFPQALAGRALSGFNLVLFIGIFSVQWGIGLAIDGLRALGWSEVNAFRGAFAGFLLCCVASYGHFVAAGARLKRDNLPS
jgi:MFS family permease